MSLVHPAALFDELLAAGPERAVLRRDDGHVVPLALDRWLGASCAVDETIAAAAVGPVLDIGCGPGRLLDSLARHGLWALGVDLSPVAVGLARRRGRRAVLGSVFDELPGAGEWATALLLDGNIGIGGDVAALLDRVRTLLRRGGRAIVEVEPPGAGTRDGHVRLELDDVTSHWFPWAHVDADGIRALATVADVRRIEDRWFAWVA
jgi:SAM-dependent methyltransferase